MWNKNEISFFRKALLDWFKLHQRDFPWRKDEISNYELILSEILLQKTKAETVSKYFSTFFNQYPDWESLVNASIADLELILKPLGLYRHRAKRIYNIAREHEKKQGILPKNKSQLQESNLSTIYLSNAFELFILKKRAALLDVNMSRVLNRFFNNKEFKDVRQDKEIQDLARKVINVKECKELNWAILDFAALTCKSKNPKCNECVLNSNCKYYNLVNQKNMDQAEDVQLNLQYGADLTLNSSRPIKVVSLFSGCGGMDLGFEGEFIVHKDSVNEFLNSDFISEHIDNKHIRLSPTKFQTLFANDILPEARNAWFNYFKNKGYKQDIYHLESIVDLVKQHYNGVRVFPEQVDIVTGGFPCQDFSLAGKRKGFNSRKDHHGKIINDLAPSIETRGQLYMWLKEVVEITRPNIFIAENVKGLVNLSNVKDIIQNDFARADGNGYLVLNPMVLHAADYGVPQSRERVIFIGIKKSALNKKALTELSRKNINDDYNPYPAPSHGFTIKGNHLKPPVKLAAIFDNLDEPEFSRDPSQMHFSKAKYMGSHCQGQTEINLNGIGPTIRAEHHGNIEFRRLSRQHNGKIFKEIDLENLKERRLTPRECALIQTFPPDFEFVIHSSNSKFLVSPSSAYKLIGNAVPPLLAYHIAKRIEKLWDLFFKTEKDGDIIKSKPYNRRVPVIT